MQNSKKSSRDRQTFGFLLFDGFSNHCLANAVEPLRAANTIAGRQIYDWRFLSLAGGAVRSSSDMAVVTEAAYALVQGDVLFVMPSYGYRSYCGYASLAALRAIVPRYAAVAGLDTGSWLLAEAGLLQGYQATIHPDEYYAFEESFAEVLAVQSRFVVDRDRITCSGAAASFDLILHMITATHGQAMGVELSQIFMMQEPDVALRPQTRDPLVLRAIAVMEAHLEAPISIGEVAGRTGCSQRVLEMRMMAHLGMSPRALYKRLRLALVRKLLQETSLKIAEVSVRAGYEDASAMARAFRREFGLAPSALRRGA